MRNSANSPKIKGAILNIFRELGLLFFNNDIGLLSKDKTIASFGRRLFLNLHKVSKQTTE